MALDPIDPKVGSLEAPEGAPPANRRRRIRRALYWLASLVILVALAFWLMVQGAAYRTFQSELTTYRGVMIGQNKIEVQYAVGIPQTVQGPETAMANGGRQSVPLRVEDVSNTHIPPRYDCIPADRSAENYDSWHYWNAEGTFDVDFNARSHRVEYITCWADRAPRQTTCPPIFGIRSRMTEDEVMARLGQPDNAELSGGGVLYSIPIAVIKKLTYNAIGLRLYLEQNQVTRIEKLAPGEVGFWWWLTHGRP